MNRLIQESNDYLVSSYCNSKRPQDEKLKAVSRQNHGARVLIRLWKRVDSIGICQSSSEKVPEISEIFALDPVPNSISICPLRPLDDFMKAGQILSEMVKACSFVRQSGPSPFCYVRDGTLPNMGQLVEHVFLNLTRIAIDTGLEFRLQLRRNLVTSKTINEKSKMML